MQIFGTSFDGHTNRVDVYENLESHLRTLAALETTARVCSASKICATLKRLPVFDQSERSKFI